MSDTATLAVIWYHVIVPMASSSSLLSSALLLPADSEQQLTLLAQLAAQLEADHSRIVVGFSSSLLLPITTIT